MYFVNDESELTVEKITDIINAFKTNELPILEKYYKYYLGKQDILNHQEPDPTKPNNKIVSNYCFEIVNTFAGYMTGQDITYKSDLDIEEIQDILNYNDVSNEDARFLKNALIYGVAYECAYIDGDGKQRFTLLDSREVIPVYYNDLEERLCAAIRWYVADKNLATGEETYYIDVYTEREKTVYQTSNTFSGMTLVDRVPNFFQQVPITVFPLNDE